MCISQVFGYDDLGAGLEDILNVRGVRGTSDMSVDCLTIGDLIERDKLCTNEIHTIRVCISS